MSKIIASDGYIRIVDIEYGINDYVILDDGCKEVIKYKGSIPYFITGELKCYLNDFIKV